jgi:hypothetical protein
LKDRDPATYGVSAKRSRMKSSLRATAKQSIQNGTKNWIAPSQELLAMTNTKRTHERDDFSSIRHPALSFCLSMISAQTLRVCREGKPVSTFPDHALSENISFSKKKEQGPSPAQKLCRPYFPAKLDLILFGGATLLVRARAPPETWTTRLQPYGQPEVVVVDHLFRLVINFSNDCSKFMHLAK